MSSRYVLNLRASKPPNNIGAKAQGLHWLMQQGAHVPDAVACTFEVQGIFETGDAHRLDILRRELAAWINPERSYAVRSAANLEDGLDTSFAGQFSSTLNVRGMDQLIEAIEQTYASLNSAGVLAYMGQSGIERQDLKMSVVIQEMVPPVLSGVSFSKNPITGLDEVMVEAVNGTGTSLVQSGVTPRRWVHKWGEWIVTPEEGDDNTAIVADLVSETRRLADLYGRPIDLEWVFDGQIVHWIQVRPITHLDHFNIYSNRISREVLPGIIKPLVWSVNVPGVNSVWMDLFTELIGPNDIDPNSLAKAFYHRAYFNMAVIGRIFHALGMPKETLELMMGLEGGDDKPRFKPGLRTLPHIPRMIRFLVGKLGFGSRVKAFLPEIRDEFHQFDIERVVSLDDGQLANDIARLTDLYLRAAYYNIVTPLLAMAYDALFRRQLARKDIQPENFDLMAGLDELKDFDPNPHLAQLHRAYKALDAQTQSQIHDSDYETFIRLPGLVPFQESVEAFIAQFGHLSDRGNDLSSVPWRENKNLVLRLIVDFVKHIDQSPKKRLEDLRLGVFERVLFGFAYRRARDFRFYREAISSTFIYGYGLFRVYFLEIGRRLAERGVIQNREDVFYLYEDEVLDVLAGKPAAISYQNEISERRSLIEASEDVILPDIVYGDEPPPLETFDEDIVKLTGIPTSRGYYKGPVKVITSVEEFGQLSQGDVLVIPFSDVAWTPLFAKAGAVVAESGGVLSHSSIVAREYNLPAVVSVNGACRLPNGQIVTVDGINGQVLLHKEG